MRQEEGSSKFIHVAGLCIQLDVGHLLRDLVDHPLVMF